MMYMVKHSRCYKKKTVFIPLYILLTITELKKNIFSKFFTNLENGNLYLTSSCKLNLTSGTKFL